jgi:hypothetical protein
MRAMLICRGVMVVMGVIVVQFVRIVFKGGEASTKDGGGGNTAVEERGADVSDSGCD